MNYKLLKKYLNQYQFHIYNFNDLSHLPNFEFDFSNKSLSIYEIVIKLYRKCFNNNYSDEIIYNSLFSNKNLDNHIYFLTSFNKIIIFGFLWADNYNYRIETVCKNLILNYQKLCFNLLLNVIIKFRKKFLQKPLMLEVDKNNNSAIECYRQLGFTGPIINGIETIKYSFRGYLIMELKFGEYININAQLLEKSYKKEIKIDNKIITVRNLKDINGITKYFYNVKDSL